MPYTVIPVRDPTTLRATGTYHLVFPHPLAATAYAETVHRLHHLWRTSRSRPDPTSSSPLFDGLDPEQQQQVASFTLGVPGQRTVHLEPLESLSRTVSTETKAAASRSASAAGTTVTAGDAAEGAHSRELRRPWRRLAEAASSKTADSREEAPSPASAAQPAEERTVVLWTEGARTSASRLGRAVVEAAAGGSLGNGRTDRIPRLDEGEEVSDGENEADCKPPATVGVLRRTLWTLETCARLVGAGGGRVAVDAEPAPAPAAVEKGITGTTSVGNGTPGNESPGNRKRQQRQKMAWEADDVWASRFLLRFAHPTEARRFVRHWHRRVLELPDARPGELTRINVEILW